MRLGLVIGLPEVLRLLAGPSAGSSRSAVPVQELLAPRFWQTGWFAGLLLLAGGLLVVAVHRLRTRSIRLRNRALNDEIAAHRSTLEALRVLAETAMDGILIVDEGRRIEYANAAALRMFAEPGTEGARLEDRPLAEILRSTPRDKEAFEFLFEKPGRREVVLEGLRGLSTFLVEASSGRMTRSSGEGAYVLILRDVTVRRHLERRLAESGKMEAIGRLTGGIAHDFNNILTVILGHVSMMKPSGDPAATASHFQEHTDRIRESAERAAHLVRNLMTFARRRTIHPELFDPNKTLHDIEPMLSRLIPESIRLDFQLDPNVGGVYADLHELEQVMINLVVNAKDAIQRQGRITVRTHRVMAIARLSVEDSGAVPVPHVAISVTDDGCGLPEDELSRVFDPFYTTKDVGRGTGLGLTSAQAFVEQAGGHISVRSKVGEGSCFEIQLPAQELHSDEELAEVVLHLPPPPERAGARILLCDDEDAVRETAARILRSAGYIVETATGPAHAIRLFDQAPEAFAALVTDMVMPEMDGRELAKELRAVRPELPVLFISGYAPDFAWADVDASADELLAKPFSPRDLLGAVSRTLMVGKT